MYTNYTPLQNYDVGKLDGELVRLEVRLQGLEAELKACQMLIKSKRREREKLFSQFNEQNNCIHQYSEMLNGNQRCDLCDLVTPKGWEAVYG